MIKYLELAQKRAESAIFTWPVIVPSWLGRLQRLHVLARHDPVFLVPCRKRELREVTPVHRREDARVEAARGHQGLPALPQHEQEPGATLLLDDALLLELVLRPHDVIDRVGF